MNDNNTTVKNGRKSDGTFAKGNPGGPGRPPKELTISNILDEILSEEVDGSTRKKIIMKRVVQKAYEGERWAVEFIANRLEGLPRQEVDSTVTNINPIIVVKDQEAKEAMEEIVEE